MKGKTSPPRRRAVRKAKNGVAAGLKAAGIVSERDRTTDPAKRTARQEIRSAILEAAEILDAEGTTPEEERLAMASYARLSGDPL